MHHQQLTEGLIFMTDIQLYCEATEPIVSENPCDADAVIIVIYWVKPIDNTGKNYSHYSVLTDADPGIEQGQQHMLVCENHFHQLDDFISDDDDITLIHSGPIERKA